MHEVRRARSDDASAVAEMLGRAFEADPVSSFLFPDAAHRLEDLRRFFGIQLRRNYLTRGEVWVEDARRAAALWMAPDPAAPGIAELWLQVGLAAVFRGRLGTARRLARLLAAQHPREAHYYLGTLGTEPAFQRRGIGTALLRPVLDRCDAAATPAYLECSREENLRFYEAGGFAVVDKVGLEGGPSLWLMWRQPATGRDLPVG